MKVDRVIFCVDENPKYYSFWNDYGYIWHKHFKLIPTLFFVGSKNVFDNNINHSVGETFHLEYIPEISDPSPNWLVTWSLFWGAAQFPNDVCFLSGIDQIPLSNYYIKESLNYKDDEYLVFFSDAYDGYNSSTLGYWNNENHHLYPSSHHIAKGKTFKDIYDIDDDWKKEANKVYRSRSKFVLNNIYYDQSPLWGMDECYSSLLLSKYHDQTVVKFLSKFKSYHQPRQLVFDSTSNFYHIDDHKLKQQYYTEVTYKQSPQKKLVDYVIENSFNINNDFIEENTSVKPRIIPPSSIGKSQVIPELDNEEDNSMQNYFESIYNQDSPGMPDNETVCGAGSKSSANINWLNFLEFILKKYNINSILDIGCGDLNFIHPFLSKNSQIKYHGYDISSNLIQSNLKRHPDISCSQLNICKDIPKVEYELCIIKEVFIHLSRENVFRALHNVKSNHHIKYLLITGHTEDFSIIEENNSGAGHFMYHFEGLQKNPIEILKEKSTIDIPDLKYRQSNLYRSKSIINL